jgi:thioredoxin 1
MRQYLLLIPAFALLMNSCTFGRGRKTQSAPPPPAPAATAGLSSATRKSSVVQITDANHEEVIRSQKVVLILFWAPWSAPDRAITPIIDAISNEYLGRVTTGKINVDENPGLAEKFGIKAIPTIVVIKDGSEQERVIGLQPKKKITDILDKQL